MTSRAAANPVGTTVEGAMILDVSSCGWNWTGDWQQPWRCGVGGEGNVFCGEGYALVPESPAYGWLAASLAALAAIAMRRNLACIFLK